MKPRDLGDDFRKTALDIMRQRGLSYGQLSQRLGVTRPYAYMVLHTKHSPCLATVAKVMDALDCEVRLVTWPR